MAATPSLSALRRDEDTTDLRLVLDDGTSLLAHRAVLAMSSPVLRRALFGSMKLPDNEPLPLPGKDTAAVQGLLAYCYGEQVVMTEETAIPLLQLADEYCIDGLKARCERYFTDNLSSVDSASTVDLFQWAQRFRCSDMLESLQEEMEKRLRAHLNAGEVEAARALATSHASFAPQLATSMQQLDSGELEVNDSDSLLLKKLLVERGANVKVLERDLIDYIVNGTLAEVEACLDAGAKPCGLNYIAYHINMSRRDGEWLAKARLLLDRGAEHVRGGIGSGKWNGETPLHFTARCCQRQGKRARNADGERIRKTGALDLALLLAEYGAPLGLRDARGKLYYEDDDDWDESWKRGMRPSEVKKAVEEAWRPRQKGRGAPQTPSSSAQTSNTEGKKRTRKGASS